jgi:hypothetical protein
MIPWRLGVALHRLLSGLGTINALPRFSGSRELADSGITDDGTTIALSRPLVPAALTGTPAQHGLFRENVVKGWVVYNGSADTITDSFNVSSIVDGAAGVDTINWDRDFADGSYCLVATVADGLSRFAELASFAAGSANVQVRSDAGTLIDASRVHAIAIGDQ